MLACCSAAGNILPPFVVFDRKWLKPEMCEGEAHGTMYGLSDSGWINGELFELWFMHHFLPYEPSATLLLDGHSSHYNPSVIRKAAEEKLIIFCLPPYSSYETQTLDKGSFSPLKTCWKEVCHQFISENPSIVVTKFSSSKLFKEAWTQALTVRNILARFHCTGIYPLDSGVLPVKAEESTSLAKRTGVKFIPLYSPRRKSSDAIVFSEEEQIKFLKRYEEGHDIETDERYKSWKMYHPQPDKKCSDISLVSTHSHISPFHSADGIASFNPINATSIDTGPSSCIADTYCNVNPFHFNDFTIKSNPLFLMTLPLT